MTCATCQPERGWWHKVFQQCKTCHGWPLPPESAMALAKTGGEYIQARREENIASAVHEAARIAFHPNGGDPTKLEVVQTCAALVSYLKTIGKTYEASEIENLIIQLGRD